MGSIAEKSSTGRTVDGFTYAEARLKIKEEYSRAESSQNGDRPGTATVPGAAARAAASKQRELLAASRAELEGLDPTERAGREATERGSSSAVASRRARLASAAELAAETAATRRVVPSSQRCGMSLDNFRKLCAESGPPLYRGTFHCMYKTALDEGPLDLLPHAA